jgi:putative DNA methylase
MTDYPKKLIEVALPLDDINAAAAREKSIRHGHPSTLHLWWARRPLAAARAVLFAQLVNDPGGKRGYGAYKGQSKDDAQKERERLFDIIRDLVKWENTNNEEVLERARSEIEKSWRETCAITGDDPDQMPPLFDPFAGGGSIPLEAQRLGLRTQASDLNPVAVIINKAMIEIPPKFVGMKPVGPEISGPKQTKAHAKDWSGAKGLAEDIRRYGYWLREEAFKRIGHLYPQVDMPKDQGGVKGTVLAWLWARTVVSPNPVLTNVHVPLISSFWLCRKKNKKVWVEPIIEGNQYTFKVCRGVPEDEETIKAGTKIARGANFRCLISGVPIDADYVKSEGKAGRMGWRLMAIVVEGKRGRNYLDPSLEQEKIAYTTKPSWRPAFPLSTHPQYMSVTNYGPTVVADLFMDRQTVALTTFLDLLQDVKEKVSADTRRLGWIDDSLPLKDGGISTNGYTDAIIFYLGIAISRLANRSSTNTFWHTSRETVEQVFARHALPMVWDTAEGNPFSSSTGNFLGQLDYMTKVIERMPVHAAPGSAFQKDARKADYEERIVSTDPPYYDNVPYADLSDFFYVWLRYGLKSIFPDLFSTMLVPKSEELVADHKRHNGKIEAENYFLDGMSQVMQTIAQQCHPAFPMTLYYAFRQSETKDQGTSSTGWETFLEAVLGAGFCLTGTWPVRTELVGNLKKNWNALASSIVLVCQKRSDYAPTISRKQFLRELEETLPESLEEMIGGKEGISPIAPVDLAQAAIGPGMAVFSKHEAVLEADGSPMTVHAALILINKAIDEYFTQAESDMGPDTRFCVDWFLQYGFAAGKFGEADVLAKAKGTSVDGIAQAGVVESGKGSVRLLHIDEYSGNWDPEKDKRLPIWEACHQLCRALKISEAEAGSLLSKMMDKGEPVRQLAYRLYTQCERKGWAEDARNYNELITSWPAILEEARKGPRSGPQRLPGME